MTQQMHTILTNFVKSCTFTKNNWHISIAIEKDISSETLLRLLRSQLSAQLEKQGLHSKLKYQLRATIKRIHNYTRQAQDEAKLLGNDVVVNCSFDERKLGRSTRDDVGELLNCNSFPVTKVITTHVSLNRIPDLTYVFSQETTEFASLNQSDVVLVTINPEYAVCYEGKQVVPEKVIWKEKNVYTKPEEDRYIEVVPVSAQNQITHGTGSEKAERTYQNGLLLFARKQLERIQKQLDPQIMYVFFSQMFEPLNKDITAILSESIRTPKIHLEFISSDQFAHLEISSGQQPKSNADETPEVTENTKTVSDLHEVTSLLRMGNVDTLYIKSDLDRFGYVTPNTQCYTYPVKGSKKVASIRPWLLKSALDISADIKVAYNQDMNSQALAIPRY